MKSCLLALSMLVLFVGCSTPCPEPFYDGAASDEAWRTMQDAESRATANDAKAIQVFFPTDGAKLDSTAAAPTFTWTTPLMASLELPARRVLPSASMLSRLEGWIYPSAWAHLPPVNGPVHWLRISAPNRSCPLEVLTSRTEWTPNAAAWAELKTFTTGTLTFDVFSAFLTENRISEGPYHFTRPHSLTVGK